MLNTISILLKKWGRTRPKPGDRRSQCSPGTVGSIGSAPYQPSWLLELPRVFRTSVVDVAINRNVIGIQRVISNPSDILDDALGVVGECEPVDVVLASVDQGP
jgi:hypothetical protein